MKHPLKKALQYFLFTSLALFLHPLTARAQMGTWSATGSMITARYSQTATLLPNGKVLQAGGYDGSDALASAELYDPATGTFSATGSMATVRLGGQTATLLPNGKVLVAGGYNGSSPLASAELYDPSAGTFSVTGSMITARYSHTATLLPDGQVLVAGGDYTGDTSGVVASAELYNPATGTFSATGSMTTARYAATATLLTNGQVLVAAGENFSTGVQASAELYDPTTGTFSSTGSMSNARYIQTATLLPNGKVLLAGGDNSEFLTSSAFLASAELYDPTTGTFSVTGSMTTARVYHSATLLPNGQVLVAGGSSATAIIATAELYNPATGIFSATGSMANARFITPATLLANGQVLVAGGYNNSVGVFSDAELYTSIILGASGLNGSNCNGTYTGTYQGNLTVSNGQICIFSNGGVTGNLTQTGGTVVLENTSFVNGNLQASGGSLSLSNSAVGNDLQITGAVTFTIGPAVIIGGNLQIQSLPVSAGIDQVCGVAVKDNLTVQKSGTAVQIGSGTGCAGNAVGGNLTVQNNTASTAIDSNTVGGNLTDQNNTAATQVSTNAVTHSLQCTGNSSITGGGNTASSKQGQCAAF